MAESNTQRSLGRYELLEEIGHGGMATVFRGRDTQLDRPVAVKVLHPHLQKTPEARRRFAREARSVARLRHPNILEIYDSSDEDGPEAFIITELLTGPTLKAFREGVPSMSAAVAVAIVVEVTKALEAAHAAGVIHRDVKPENVLLHRASCLKLTDFGIAQWVDAQSFTATGQILGSPGHMAPEQIEGGKSDARTDVFALGTLLYYLTTGRLPFEGNHPHQVLRKVLEGDYLPPLRACPAMGAGVAAIIEKALSRVPDARPASAAVFREDLSRWLEEEGVEDSQALLRAYLERPADVEQKVLTQSVVQTLARCHHALARRDDPTAIAHLNRVLALDGQNEEAAGILRRLGAGHQRHRLLGGTVVALALVGCGALALAFWDADSTRRRPAAREAGPILPAVVPELVAVARSGRGRDPTDPHPAAIRADTGSQHPRVEGRAAAPSAGAAEGFRTVCFAPSPSNVSLSVDGQAAAPFTALSRCRSLSFGTHAVNAEGAESCCEPLFHSFVVRPGVGEQREFLTLRFKAARLYVNLRAEGTNPPNGEVHVEGGPQGATRAFLEVPMETFRQQRAFRVVVPGYAPYNGVVELIAGAQVQAPVLLRALPPGTQGNPPEAVSSGDEGDEP